jgi:uncharacterized integral membrane protein
MSFLGRLRGADPGQWQPRLWLVLVGLLLIAAYVIAFVVKNDDSVSIDFVFFTAHVSLIWLILLCLGLGLAGGLLLSQFYRRRMGRSSAGFPKQARPSTPSAEKRG